MAFTDSVAAMRGEMREMARWCTGITRAHEDTLRRCTDLGDELGRCRGEVERLQLEVINSEVGVRWLLIQNTRDGLSTL